MSFHEKAENFRCLILVSLLSNYNFTLFREINFMYNVNSNCQFISKLATVEFQKHVGTKKDQDGNLSV